MSNPAQATAMPRTFNLSESVHAVIEHLQNRLSGEAELRGQPTGYPDLDEFTKGLKWDSRQANDSRKREVAEIVSSIKSLARELGVPILLLAELNRGPERRKGKSAGIPRLSDLRAFGPIVKYADLIGLLYREAYYSDNPQEMEVGKSGLILANIRQAEFGEVPLSFHAEIRRFDAS